VTASGRARWPGDCIERRGSGGKAGGRRNNQLKSESERRRIIIEIWQYRRQAKIVASAGDRRRAKMSHRQWASASASGGSAPVEVKARRGGEAIRKSANQRQLVIETHRRSKT